MNFFYGLQNIAGNISQSARILIHNQLFVGFIAGFIVAAIMYLFIITENPHHVPTMLLNSKSDSFQKISDRTVEGKFVSSYTAFEKDFNRLRLVVYSLFLVFLTVVSISIAFY